MRRALALTLLLFIGSVSSLVCLHKQVNKDKEAISIEETTLYGDLDQAHNLQINLGTHVYYRLLWDTGYTIGPDAPTQAKFSFSRKDMRTEWMQTENNRRYHQPEIYIGMDSHMGIFHGSMSGGRIDTSYQGPIINDVASRTKAGEEREETIYIKDYFDFYPLSIGGTWRWGFANNEEVDRIFSEFFKIPVHPEHRINIGVAKDSTGFINSVSSSPAGDSNVQFLTEGVVIEEDCYFSLRPVTLSGELLDVSHIPGGFGIYYSTYPEPYGLLTPLEEGDLKLVYPLDETKEEVMALHANKEEDRLLLVTLENEAYMLTLIDRSSMQQIQKIKIMEAGPERELSHWHGFNQLYVYEDFLLATLQDGRFALLTREASGNYRVEFEADFNRLEDLKHGFSYNLVMDYDGHKLAVATLQANYGPPHHVCSFYVMVFDRQGSLTYAGYYESSQDKDAATGMNEIHHPLPTEYKEPPLQVTWGE